MEFQKKPKSSAQQGLASVALRHTPAPVQPDLVVQRQRTLRKLQRNLEQHTVRPVAVQRQAAEPVMQAASLLHQEEQRLTVQRQEIQEQMAEVQASVPLPTGALQRAIQRQDEQQAPLIPVAKPQSIGDWVTVMRSQAEQVEGQRLSPREMAQYTALQRQVTQTLVQGFKQDRQPPQQRYAQYAEHLAALQGTPTSARVATVALGMMPVSERPALQRALDEVLQREAEQKQQRPAALQLYSLQRQLAELEQQATHSVFERIQARRGSGTPLPEEVLHHLEQGLNHDLSSVRIHDDQEADELAKKVNAVAFTTGTDIYFQSGKFNPNTQSGLELLAHEVTHTVQQSKGQVGKGVDPDAGLEAEARVMGQKLSKLQPRPSSIYQAAFPKQAPQRIGAMQRLKEKVPAPSPLLGTLTTGQLPSSPVGFVWQTADGGVQVREAPMGKVLGKIPNTTRLQLLRYDPKQKAYSVRSPNGLQGWVTESYLKIPPVELAQDPHLRFYVPKEGEGIFSVVQHEYGTMKFGQDARYFTNVLRAVNKPEAFMVKEPHYKGFLDAEYEHVIASMTSGRDANAIQLKKVTPFWLPSLEGAKNVKAHSGSFSKQILEATQKTFGDAGEKALYAGMFITGMQVGVLKSIWDALVGLVDTALLPIHVITAIYKTIEDALNHELFSKIGEIYTFLMNGGVQKLAGMLIAEFEAGWNNKNPLKAWEYRGQIVGYVVTEIITTFIPIAGVVTKAAKAVKLIEFIREKFEWIAAASRKALKMLDNVKIKLPPPGPSPQMAMAGGMSMSAPQQEVSLGHVLRTAKNKAGATVITGLSKAEQLAQKAANWPKVKRLIGKAPPVTLLEGYFYRTQGSRRQIVRTSADDDKFVALTIDEKGKVRVADPNVSDRISDPTKMNKNFKLAMGRDKLEGYQLHHLIPDNKVRSHSLMQWAQGNGFYDLDYADNLIEMPGTVNARTKVAKEGLDNGLEVIGHFGSHDKYDAIVQQKLDELYRLLRKDYGTNLTGAGAREAFELGIKVIEDDLRKMIKDGKVPTRIDSETGTKVISQVTSSSIIEIGKSQV